MRWTLFALLLIGCSSNQQTPADSGDHCDVACQYTCSEGKVWGLTGGPCGPCSNTGKLVYTCPSGTCTEPTRIGVTGWVRDPSDFCAPRDAAADATDDAVSDVAADTDAKSD